ncbi:MAG: hypothetical protein LT070_13745 [Solirubrobacteraceae bacterium]|nr:hypothetical protein [Solirubrobacteraceae bacterium]
MTAPLDLERLLRELSEARVRYVVIGGVAVVAHGSLRTTQDLDLVPDPDADNLLRLGNLLARLDARLTLSPDREFGPRERSALARGRSLSIETSLGAVDIVQRLPGTPSFAELDASAIEARPGGVAVRIASLEHLRAMKRARSGAQDLADLAALDALAEQPADE